jgi:hypothetical protein
VKHQARLKELTPRRRATLEWLKKSYPDRSEQALPRRDRRTVRKEFHVDSRAPELNADMPSRFLNVGWDVSRERIITKTTTNSISGDGFIRATHQTSAVAERGIIFSCGPQSGST